MLLYSLMDNSVFQFNQLNFAVYFQTYNFYKVLTYPKNVSNTFLSISGNMHLYLDAT